MGVLWVEKLFGDSLMCLTCVLHMLKVTLFWFLDKSGVYILSDFHVFGLKMRVLEAKKLVGVGLTCLKLETLVTSSGLNVGQSTHCTIFPRDPEDLNLLRYIAYSKINVHLIYRHIMKSIIMSNIVRQDFSFKYPGIINARTFSQS